MELIKNTDDNETIVVKSKRDASASSKPQVNPFYNYLLHLFLILGFQTMNNNLI